MPRVELEKGNKLAVRVYARVSKPPLLVRPLGSGSVFLRCDSIAMQAMRNVTPSKSSKVAPSSIYEVAPTVLAAVPIL